MEKMPPTRYRLKLPDGGFVDAVIDQEMLEIAARVKAAMDGNQAPNPRDLQRLMGWAMTGEL